LKNTFKKVTSMILAIAVVFGMMPRMSLSSLYAASGSVNYTVTADASTATNHTGMLGDTDADGNRYSGRVWTDKSVYVNGASVSLDGVTTPARNDFMIVYSALGSTASVSHEMQSANKLDVVMVLDLSRSMQTSVGNGQDRLDTTVAAANRLLAELLKVGNDNRLGIVTYYSDDHTLLPLGQYTVSANDTNGFINQSGSILSTDGHSNTVSTGSGTNLQSGIDAGMAMLASADNTSGRTPVLIVMTDGAANRAVNTTFYNIDSGAAVGSGSSDLTAGIAISTLMNAAYWKAAVANHYGIAPMVLGVGVGLTTTSALIMDPATYFKTAANGGTSVANTAYNLYTRWVNSSSSVSQSISGNNWTLPQLPANDTRGVTKAQVQQYINYVDRYWGVTEATAENMNAVFDEITSTISTPAFNPITSTTTVGGVQHSVPMTYVDFLGDYMELKGFEYVTLFGNKYNISLRSTADPTYETVDGVLYKTDVATYNVGNGEDVTHTVLDTTFDVTENVWITVTTETPGTYLNGVFTASGVAKQTVRVMINDVALPVISDIVETETVGGVTTSTYVEESEDPIRVYYHVGIADSIKDTSGNVDLTKVDPAYIAANTEDGKVNFYANQHGVMNAEAAEYVGDAHVSFSPSDENRFYYHQANQPIYKNDGGFENVSPSNLFGIEVSDYTGTLVPLKVGDVYNADQGVIGSNRVWTLANWYTPGANDTAVEHNYYVYATLDDLVYASVLGYEKADGTVSYLNFDGSTITEGTVGYMPIDVSPSSPIADKVAALQAYGLAAQTYAGNNNISVDDLCLYVAVNSARIPRLHNMAVNKAANTTGTATVAYSPQYNDDTAHVGDITVWLGNNGLLAVERDEGLLISKEVDTFYGNDTAENKEFTFTIAASDTSFAQTVNLRTYRADGSFVSSVLTFVNGQAQITLKDGEYAYIIGSALTGRTFTVTENAEDYYKVSSVTVDGNTAANGASVTVTDGTIHEVDFVNTAKEFGSMTVTKVVTHDFGADFQTPGDAFEILMTFTAPDGSLLANKTFAAIMPNGSGTITGTITTDANGQYTVVLTHNQQLQINGLEAGTIVSGQEINVPHGFTPTYWNAGVTGGQVTIVKDQTVAAGVTNHYNPDDASYSLTLRSDKILNDLNDPARQFEILVEKYIDDAWVSDWKTPGTAEKYTIDADGVEETYVLADTYSEPGTYWYRVYESQRGTTKGGITYDSVAYIFTVEVIDNQGALVIDRVQYYKSDNGVGGANTNITGQTELDGVDFRNQYSANHAEVQLELEKLMSSPSGSTNYSLAGYQFQLIPGDATGTNFNGTPINSTITNERGYAAINLTYNYDGNLYDDHTETFYYMLIEHVPTTGVNGVTYSTQRYLVEVRVDHNQSTQTLTPTVTVTNFADSTQTWTDPETIYFTNIYDPDPASLSFSALKTLNGRDLQAGEFGFTLKQVVSPADTTAVPEGQRLFAPMGASNDANGLADFGTVTFNKVGTYYLAVTEDTGNKGGVTYDNTVYIIEVVVTDSGSDAQLEATATVLNTQEDETTNLPFVNTYTTQPVTFTPEAGKQLNGKTLTAGEFTFTMTELVSIDGAAKADGYTSSVANTAEGDVKFAPITYTAPGTYYYHVGEVTGTKGGITYDSNKYHVVVTVVDDGQGNLKVDTVKWYNHDSYTTPIADNALQIGDNGFARAQFVNTYSATGSLTLQASKSISGRGWLNGETFSLYLQEGNTVLDTITATNSDVYDFDPINYTQADAGTHTYTIVEGNGGTSSNGLTYDNTVYTVTVNVADNGNGTLTIDYSMTSDTSGSNYTVAGFVNRYTTTDKEVDVVVTKQLTGRDLIAGEFTFNLYEAYMVNGKLIQGSQIGQSVQNAANGTVAFDPFTVTKAIFDDLEIDDGVVDGTTYIHFIVEEVVPTNPSDTITYVDYKLGLTYKLVDNGDGTVTVTLDSVVKIAADGTETDNGTNTVFVNSYAAKEGTLDFVAGTKVITAPAGVTPQYGLNSFKFSLYHADANYTVGNALYTGVSADAAGVIDFTNMALTPNDLSAGHLYFVVAEDIPDNADKAAGITYDTTKFGLKYRIYDDQQGHIAAELVEVKNLTTGNTVTGYTFENRYEGEPTTATFEVGKLVEQPYDGYVLNDGDFTFSLFEATENGGTYTKGAAVAGYQNIGNIADKVTFSNVGFDTPGTFYYIITEDNGGKDYITYDTEQIVVKVVVTDDGDGTLDAAVSYIDGDNSNTVGFENQYKIINNTSVSFSANKELTGRDLQAGEFTFNIYKGAVNGNIIEKVGSPIEHMQNPANGVLNFDSINLTTAGTHYFVIEEARGTKGGITYDTTQYWVTVEVKDNGQGSLVITSETYQKAPENASATAVQKQDIVFTNSYDATDATALIPNVQKVIDQHQDARFELQAGDFTFELYKADSTYAVTGSDLLQEKTNTANGSVIFDDIIITKAQFDALDTDNDDVVYLYYVIVEQIPDQKFAGMTYDETAYGLTYKLVDDGLGHLSADLTEKVKLDQANTAVNELVFTNAYAGASVDFTVKVQKDLTGRDLIDGEFTFNLYEGDFTMGSTLADNVMTIVGDPIDTATNAGNDVIFDKLTFTEPGLYYYVITEAEGSKGGVTYDDSKIYLGIMVIDDGSGYLQVDIDYADESYNSLPVPTFNNSYDTTDGAVILGGYKQLKGNRDLVEGEFIFELYEANAQYATAGEAIGTAKNDAEGYYRFETIVKEQAGTYYYVVAERDTKGENVVYDTTAYGVKATVSDNGLGELVTTYEITNLKTGEAAQGINFVNAYNDVVDTGDSSDMMPIIIGLGASVLVLAVLVFTKKKKEF